MGIDSEMLGASSDGESKAARSRRLMRREAEIERILEDSARDGHPVSIETAAAMAVHREREEGVREKRRGGRTASALRWIKTRAAGCLALAATAVTIAATIRNATQRWAASHRKRGGGG